jgi:uncharacterized protein
MKDPTHTTSHSPFRVRLKDLPTHRRIEVDGPFVARALVGLPLREALEVPVDDPAAGAGVAELDLYAEAEHGVGGGSVFASGRIDGWLMVACSRCVGPVKVPLAETLRVTYVPHHAAPERDDSAAEETDKKRPGAKGGKGGKAEADDADDGVELAEDDLDVFPYEGDVVDLEPLIREQFILAVPFAPLCKDDCKGLCPMCGIDRNVETCRCEKPVDPRFAGLEALKKGLKPTP